MDPKGANLASTDLLEISQLVSGSYVTKSITGAEIISGATTGFVPTSRTLTINGTTQDLSADRTFTISTGITIGTTAITSGTVGRVLFEGTGNVVSESANLFWDNTNGRLGIGTSSPESKNHVLSTDSNTIQLLEKTNGPTTSLSILTSLRTTFATAPSNNAGPALTFDLKVGASNAVLGYINTVRWNNNAGGLMQLATNANGVIEPKLNIFPNGNILIQGGGVTTDAGFKLDVNGTARVRGTGTTSATTALTIQNSAGAISLRVTDDGSVTNYGKNAITTNTAFGIGALIKVTFGSLNSAFGQDALNGNTGGQANNAFGRESLLSNTSGNFNAGFGNQALLGNTTGSSNSAFGLFALSSNSTGASNSALGYNTQTGNFSGSVILGRDAVANGANQFVVGSTGTNAGLVDTAVVVPDKRWKVKINGVDYYIALQTI